MARMMIHSTMTVLLCLSASGCLEKTGSEATSSDDKPVGGNGSVPGCDSNGESSKKNPHCNQTNPPSQELSGFSKVSFSDGHVCALSEDGDLYCWGDNREGQAGDNSLGFISKPQKIGVNYKEVSTGAGHTCAITNDNQLKCWGLNSSGEVGDGTNINRSSPTLIDPGTKYVQVSASQQSTCAITSTGILKCWGLNSYGLAEHNTYGYGSLGDGTNVNRYTPVVIDPGVSYKSVSGRFLHRCAITTTGVLKCWGWNSLYAVGDGTRVNRSRPVVVDYGTTYSQVTAGIGQSCAITSSGVLKCWGGNQSFSTGNGALPGQNYDVPRPTIIDAGVPYKSVAMNGFHGTCGVTSMDDLKCWGAYQHESLFYNLEGLDQYPRLPKLFDTAFKFKSVSSNVGGFLCGTTVDNKIRCWGTTWYDLFGDGNNSRTYYPPMEL